MKTLLERFRELPDYRKCKQLKFNVGEVMYTPADNTIRNVYLNIDLEALNKMFEDWSHEIARRDGLSSLNIVSSDGKTMRGSKNKIRNEKARHIVSLFLSEQKITLAQTKVDEKSNEIPALLELLESLKLENCVITVDALHTQKKL